MAYNRNPKRILITGTFPIFPKIEISNLVEEMGEIVVFDVSSGGCLYPDYQGRKTGNNPTLRTTNDRLEFIERMVTELSVDGVLYYVLKGCALYDIELHCVEKAMKEKNIPVIRVETDCNPESREKLRARMGMFIEMLNKNRIGKMS